MNKIKELCASTNEEILIKTIQKLPKNQQEAVKTCFDASKVVSSNGRRYTLNWIYECMLIRIKSRKTYEHIRIHNILTLPSVETIRKYLKHTKGVYGFQPSTFTCLKEKSKHININERRGTIIYIVYLLKKMQLIFYLIYKKVLYCWMK